MKFILLLFILVPFISFSQELDSTKRVPFQNIFGSDCDGDTVILDLGKNKQCILFKNENKLIGKRNGKIKWELDLEKAFNSSEIESICIMTKGFYKNPRKATVYVLLNQKEESWAMFVKFSSGKVIKNVRQKFQ